MTGDALSHGAPIENAGGAAGSALQALIDALSEDEPSQAVADRADAALEAWRGRRRRADAGTPAETSATAPLSPSPTQVPTLDVARFMGADGFDVTAFIDAACLDFEVAAAPAAPAPRPTDDATIVRLDATRAARLAAEAAETGAAPEAVLALAIDLYFAVLDRADA